MAFTIFAIDRTSSSRLNRLTLFMSQEYLPYKETDASGQVLPNQEWQHPEPNTLYYVRLGELACDGRVDGLLQSVLDLGASTLGGHARIIMAKTIPSWLRSRLETWDARELRSVRQEREEQHARMAAEAAIRSPVYATCPRCGVENEQCKSTEHRGENRCLACNGGLADTRRRHCNNCLDLPFRVKREQALGRRIVYEGEAYNS